VDLAATVLEAPLLKLDRLLHLLPSAARYPGALQTAQCAPCKAVSEFKVQRECNHLVDRLR